MRNRMQVSVLTGIVLASGLMLSASQQAAAFGQQWRPAAPIHTAHQTHRATFRRVANVPSFRPRVAQSQPRHSAAMRNTYPAAQDYERSGRGYDLAPAPAHWSVARPELMRTPSYTGAAPVFAPATGFGQAPTAWGMPGMPAWANPFAQMAQGFPYAMPFSRQASWQPYFSQPYHAPAARIDRRYSAHSSTYRQAGQMAPSPARTALSSWRPIAAASSYTTPRAMHHGYRSVMPVQPAYVRPLAQTVAPQAGRYAWRPAIGDVPRQWQGRDFRPASHGQRLASAANNGVNGATRVTLPGWVSTQKDPLELACDWCSGS
jgi:hypothetical protein